MAEAEKKVKKFTLPISLKTLHDNKKNQTHQFIRRFDSDPKEMPNRKQKNTSSLFKLNPSSRALVEEIPIETLRKKSKSQQLESLNAQRKVQPYNLFEHHKEIEPRMLKEKRFAPKKYDIDLRAFSQRTDNLPQKAHLEQEEKYEIVQPSTNYHIKHHSDNQIFQPTIVQTPILPIFPSELHPNISQTTKKIQEGEGTWRIGKMLVKKGKCQLRIGQFVYEGMQVEGQGRSGLLKQNNLHLLPNWKNMFIFQPHEDLFLGK